MKNNSLIEALFEKTGKLFRAYAVPFLSAFLCGMLAHGYAFFNKLLNADETAALFSKGADITSGRWGLAVSSYLFPDVSMPWIYGLLSLLFLSIAACITVRIFKIKSPVLQAVLAGSITVFPAQTGTFCFLYTSAPYALAVLLTVLSVYLCAEGKWGEYILACALLAFALLIYQAYISIAASFFVILLIIKIVDGEEISDVFKSALKYFSLLLLTLGIYLLATYLVKLTAGNEYQEYEVFAGGNILRRVLSAYSSFVKVFLKGYFGFVPTRLSMLTHIVCAAVVGFSLFAVCAKQKNRQKLLFLAGLLVIFPLSVNCLYLIASVNIIHSLSQFGFVAVYVLSAAAADRFMAEKLLPLRDTVIAAFAVVIVSNVFFANEVYLKMYLEYENAYAFYDTLMTQVMSTPGFGEYTVIDIVGNEHRGEYEQEKIDTRGLTGPNGNLIDIYTRCDFIRNYLGQEHYIYREDIIWIDWFYDMPTYPDPGSIVYREGEDRIVVKLS